MEQSSFPLSYPLTVFLSQGLFSFHKQIIFKLKSSGLWLCPVIPMWLVDCGTVVKLCAKLDLIPHRRLTGTSGRQQHFVSAETLLLGLQYKV